MTRIVLFLATIVLATPLARVANSHDLPRERTLMLQVRPDSVDVMIVYLEPPSDDLAFFKTRYDFNRDGRIGPHEAIFAIDAWLPRATQNLTFTFNGKTLTRTEPPKVKFTNKHHGALASALLLTFELPDDPKFTPATLRISRDNQSTNHATSNFPTLVRYQLDRELRYESLPKNASRTDTGSRTTPVELPPGTSLTTEISYATN